MGINLLQPNFKWPSWPQWKRLPKILTGKDRIVIFALLLAFIGSASFLYLYNHYKDTVETASYGGKYTEGIIGVPRYVNPVLSATNDADKDIVRLVFSGLMKYNNKGEIVTDLAEKYTVSEDGKTYEFKIKENLQWHDGVAITTDDVIYTLQTIQNIDYASPLRINWQGVEINKIDNLTVRFVLKNPYAPFLVNTTVGILPSHIWQGIPAANFSLAEYNLKPIGSGPYKFGQLQQDEKGVIQSIQLNASDNYYGKKPYIKNVVFKFFKKQADAINAFNLQEIDGINYISSTSKNQLDNSRAKIYKVSLPRYFAVFFNQSKNKSLSDKTVRQALAYSVNKEEIINKVLNGEAEIVHSPILSWMDSYTAEIDMYDFSPEHAKNILEAAGWKDENNDGIREKKIGTDKDPTLLKIVITTIQQPELEEAANLIKQYWKEIGAETEIIAATPKDIQDFNIKTREYEALFFGELLTSDPDPYSFWHSSQKRDPGLNLALYGTSDTDKLLEEARYLNDNTKRTEKYKEFQKIITKDLPAIFLYNPFYLYLQDTKVKGVEINHIPLPSERLAGIEEWYVETERVKK